ncbi:TPA: hypothetical protein DDX46_02830 [Candidatus Saccharibacteria bacterium]|nr:MAG: hypothetical protein UW38_C0001G0386 [Candidatus Saccharibacteria bacterium GW2011_GWC2_44_17]OGL33365.1 MAG: hypothetical protein A3E20_00385 [Candidatus Saccharibacteria bacterium RIFCSPHIGHO2_12_FULL_47_16]HBH77659.1 hypothetical protein [Candidatus Saccharibacteria bacterium]
MDKYTAYETLLKKTDTIRDQQDTPIDKEVKPIIAALWLHGFTTSGSCAGHIDSESRGPYIHITSSDFDAQYNTFNEAINAGRMAEARQLKQKIYDSSLTVYSRIFSLLNKFYKNTNFDYNHLIIAYAQLNGEIYLYFNDVRIADTFNHEQRRAWLEECHYELQRLTDFLLSQPIYVRQ